MATTAVREEGRRMQREGLIRKTPQPPFDTSGHPHSRPRVLVLIVAYNAEKTISEVVRRIPKDLAATNDLEVLIIDDASRDATFDKSYSASRAGYLPFPVHALFNPVNQGYGGNQKLGYHYAIEKGFDFVALLHGDGQYAPECLPTLLEPLRQGEAEAVMGSRMLRGGGALKGGMPLYKFIGNKVLTWLENRLLRTDLSEFHCGYRIYSVEALRAIPFDRNSNDFHFDTEIIIQLQIAARSIRELPIPTYYGDEICHVNGIRYAWNVLMAALKARLQEMSLFYDRRFDCAPAEKGPYPPKFGYESPHTIAFDRIRPGARVLDLGCGAGYLGSVLRKQKRCHVTGLDVNPVNDGTLDGFRLWDLNTGVPAIEANQYEAVVMLDVIEHLNRPESFLEELRQRLSANYSIELLISTANVGFFVTRAMLLLGQFNYGPRGILDMTHTRLFTFGSLRRALNQAGFDIIETRGVPAPYPLAIGDNRVSRLLLFINQLLIRFSRGLFAYQIFIRAKPQPSLQSLLNRAETESTSRILQIERVAARVGS
jgi:glycosyltransferase involved in cell wall biosynthesis